MSGEQFRPLPRSVWIEFGRNFRQLRLQTGLTQEAFASDMGTSRRRISNIERGRVHPPFGHDFYSRLTEVEGMSEFDVSKLLASISEPVRPVHRIFSPVEDVDIILTVRSTRINDREIDLLQSQLADVVTDFVESV